MTRHDDATRLRHMLDHAVEARDMAHGRSRSDLDDDRQLNLALVRLMEIIGEATGRVSKSTCELGSVLGAAVTALTASVFLVAAGGTGGAVAAEAVMPREKYVLLDSRLIDTTENARLAVGTAKKHPANPLFGAERPWEQTMHHMYANVVLDADDQLYKIWYFSTISGPPEQVDWGQHVTPGPLAPKEEKQGNLATLYAFSRDGIQWEKPALDLYRYQGGPTNIVVWGTHGTGIFKDPRDTDPNRRYKRIAGRIPHGTLDAAFSADGIHWGQRFSIANARGDTHNNALWAPELNKYVAFTREYPGIRTVLRMESEDFINWSTPVEVLRGPVAAQTYSMPVFRYADVYLGLVAIFHTSGALHGRVATELAWSPDTKVWHRIDEGSQLIPLSETAGDTDWGCIYAAATPVVLQDEIRIYYSGQKKTHDWNDGWLCLATLRPDGWAGYQPIDDGHPATVHTRPVICTGGTLRISADAAGGAVTLTAVGTDGKELATSEPLTGDVTAAEVHWQDGFELASLKDKSVRFRFRLSKARVYSFSFRT